MKSKLAILAVLLSMFLLPGCTSSAEPPTLSVSIDSTQIQYELQSIPESDRPFQGLLNSYGGIDGLYYNHYGDYGDPIQIEINGAAPDDIRIFDSFVNEDGSIDEEKQIFGFRKEPLLTIPMEQRMPAANKLSGVVPERGSLIRGFRVRLMYGANHFDYLFVVRTDAKIWQAAPKAIASTSGNTNLFLNSTIPGYDEFYFRSHPIDNSLSTPESSWPQIIGYDSSINLTFPEDGAPDTIELLNDVMVLTGANYEYQDDTRTLPASEVMTGSDGFSVTVKPEYFAEGDEYCNVLHAFCTWDGLTSVYTIIFRINP